MCRFCKEPCGDREFCDEECFNAFEEAWSELAGPAELIDLEPKPQNEYAVRSL